MTEHFNDPPDSEWKPLNENFEDGKAVAPQLDAAWLRAVAKMLNNVSGVGCTVVKQVDGSWQIWNDFAVLGDKGLFKVPLLRAYQKSNGALVAADQEYDSSTMTLRMTWDYPRSIEV